MGNCRFESPGVSTTLENSSPELYELLVRRRGWTIERYSEFITEAMIAALVPENDYTDR